MPRPLIFVCGLPRSGTTWIGKTFDSHPNTVYLHEPDSVHRLHRIPVAPNMSAAQTHRADIQSYIESLPRVLSTKVNGTLPVFAKRRDSRLSLPLRKGACLGAKLGARLFGEFPLPPLAHGTADQPIVWKSIESTGRLGLFVRLSGTVRTIHILRHPCGYVASVLRGESGKQFQDRDSASEDFEYYELLMHTIPALRYGITLGKLRGMTAIERHAWRWVLLNEKAMDDCAGFPGYHPIRYEDLCVDPLAGFRRLFQFTQLDWHPQVEAFIGDSISTDHSSYYSLHKDPRRAATKWRDQLTSEDVHRILGIVEQTKIGRFYRTPVAGKELRFATANAA